MNQDSINKIAIIGGGPATLYLLKHFYLIQLNPIEIHVFEKQEEFGKGMPYSTLGACNEHVANISANEIPSLNTPFKDWYEKLDQHYKDQFIPLYNEFDEDLVIPRLLLGEYLAHEFDFYFYALKKKGFQMVKHPSTLVKDIIPDKEEHEFNILTAEGNLLPFHQIILCTGHTWPKLNEGKIKNWFDSPYPPSKLHGIENSTIAIKGASLTAVDAVKTLARNNGDFIWTENNQLHYEIHPENRNFKINIFTLDGLLPALRFYTEGNGLENSETLELPEIRAYKEKHENFVDLDYIYQKFFLEVLKKDDPVFYNEIKDFTIQEFIAHEMAFRKRVNSFDLFRAEYIESEKTERRHQPVAWKNALNGLSYAMNYPAKHFSAEDMLRMRKELMPLISIIIAALPESSYQEIMALHKAGVLDVIAVDKDSHVEPRKEGGATYYFKAENGEETKVAFDVYVDATGQKAITLDKFPFQSLVQEGLVTKAYLPFKDVANARNPALNADDIHIDSNNQAYLYVAGLEVNDYFQLMNPYGEAQTNLYCMTVPFIAGLNPDYSGLDFCDTAAPRIAKSIAENISKGEPKT
ncbi:MAG: FAD/NAD(P)-binding protein [Weeksellaceae bacterium]